MRDSLFEPIIEWYLSRYGEAVRWDGVLGRFPILIQGAVYLGLARFVGKGTVVSDWKDGIEGIRPGKAIFYVG
jgi:hypothetical protein